MSPIHRAWSRSGIRPGIYAGFRCATDHSILGAACQPGSPGSSVGVCRSRVNAADISGCATRMNHGVAQPGVNAGPTTASRQRGVNAAISAYTRRRGKVGEQAAGTAGCWALPATSGTELKRKGKLAAGSSPSDRLSAADLVSRLHDRTLLIESLLSIRDPRLILIGQLVERHPHYGRPAFDPIRLGRAHTRAAVNESDGLYTLRGLK